MAVTQPISIRLDQEVNGRLRRLAHQTRRPLGRLINELLDQSLRTQQFPGIIFVQSPVGPCAHLAGTGLDVWEAVALIRAYEGAVERLLQEHCNLTRRDVQNALAYAAAYPEEIEGAIRENERPMDEVIRNSPFIRKVVV